MAYIFPTAEVFAEGDTISPWSFNENFSLVYSELNGRLDRENFGKNIFDQTRIFDSDQISALTFWEEGVAFYSVTKANGIGSDFWQIIPKTSATDPLILTPSCTEGGLEVEANIGWHVTAMVGDFAFYIGIFVDGELVAKSPGDVALAADDRGCAACGANIPIGAGVKNIEFKWAITQTGTDAVTIEFERRMVYSRGVRA